MRNFMNFLMIVALATMVIISCENNLVKPIVEELPTIQFTTSNSGGDETTTQVQLEVSLSKEFDKDVSADYTIIGGTASVADGDYSLNNGTITITAGEISTNIAVTVIDDETEEGDETIIVALSAPINATLGDQFWHTYTVIDNELSIRPIVQFTSPTSSISESSTSINIEVSLSEQSSREISVDYTVIGGTATANDTDFTLINGMVTFDAGSVSENITLTLINDDLFEQNETIIIALSNPINAELGDTFWHTHTILDDEVGIGKITLISISAEGMSKAIVGNDGQMWLPKYEMPQVLAKIASADIDFGSMNATRSLMYVVVNEGDRDVFDIGFAADSLTIVPHTIGLIAVSVQGTEVSAYPIITITKEHVLPLSGVGSLLDMVVGAFTDTLNLTYNYEQGQDTITVVDPYVVGGIRMGAVINLIASGVNLSDYSLQMPTITLPGYSYQFVDIPPIESSMMDTIIIANQGNVSLAIRIESMLHAQTVLDSILLPNDSLDLSGILRGQIFLTSDSTGYTSGELIILGANYNQPYLINFFGDVWTSGIVGVMIGEIP